jgi:hypothetical protein
MDKPEWFTRDHIVLARRLSRLRDRSRSVH